MTVEDVLKSAHQFFESSLKSARQLVESYPLARVDLRSITHSQASAVFFAFFYVFPMPTPIPHPLIALTYPTLIGRHATAPFGARGAAATGGVGLISILDRSYNTMLESTFLLILASLGVFFIGMFAGVLVAGYLVGYFRKPQTPQIVHNFYHSNGDDVIESER